MSSIRASRAVPDDAAGNRWVAALIFIGCSAVLLIAAYLTPGQGLQETVGWPVCGFKLTTALPCATCGMTTAFTYAAEGDLLGALRVQPAAAILAVLTAGMTIISGYALLTGVPLAPLGRAIWQPRVIIAGIAILLAAWAYTAAFTICTGACPT